MTKMGKIEQVLNVEQNIIYTREGEQRTYEMTLLLDNNETIVLKNCKEIIPPWSIGSEISYNIKNGEVDKFFIKNTENHDLRRVM